MGQLYWDRNDNGSGAGGASPGGSWDGSSLNWNANADGTDSAGAWQADNTAVFSAGSDATGAFTITLVGTQSAAGVTVEEGTPTFSGDELDLTNGSNLVINDNLTANFNNVIGGGGGLNKQGNGTLILTNAANTYSGDNNIIGGTIVIAADGALGNASNQINLSSGAVRFTANLSTARNVNLNGDGTFDTGSNDGTLSGVVNGGGAINKLGSGSLTLSNDGNGFDGQLNILSGAVVTTATNGLGSTNGNTTVSDGAALVINNTINIPEPIHITGTGINNAGAIRKLGSNATLSGGITLDGPARINSDANTLTISSNAISGSDTNLTVGGGGNVTVSSGILLLGTGTLIKDGTGTLALSNGNTMGGVKISGGTVTAPTAGGGPTALGTDPSVAPGNSGYASSYILLDGGTLWCTSTSFGGSFTQKERGISLTSKGGKVGCADSADNHLNQNVVYNGIVSLDPSTTTATLYKVGTGEFRAGPPSGGSGFQNTRLEIDSGTYRVSTATGPGTTPSGDGAFGQVPGQYDAAAIYANGTGTIRGNGGACIALSASVTTPANRGITIGASGLTVETNATWTVKSIITGPGALSLNENGFTTSVISSGQSLVLSGSNTYQGATNIYDATLNVQGGFAIPDSSPVYIAPATTVTVVDNSGNPLTTQNNKAVLLVTNSETIGSLAGGSPNYGTVSIAANQSLSTGANNSSTQFDGIIGGAGGLTKAGSGTFSVTAANTYTGPTSVSAGTLKVNNSAAAPLTANTAGTDIQGGRVIFDYSGGSSPRSTIVPMLAAGYASNFTDTANKIHSSTGTSKLGLGWADDNSSQFTVAYTYLGDANLDSHVNSDDFVLLGQGFGKTGQVWANGDFNYDGVVNALDFNALATNFGASVAGAPPALGSVVPEPAMFTVVGLSLLSLARRRRGA